LIFNNVDLKQRGNVNLLTGTEDGWSEWDRFVFFHRKEWFCFMKRVATIWSRNEF